MKNYKPVINEHFVYLKSDSNFNDKCLYGYINRRGNAQIMDKRSKPPNPMQAIGSTGAVKKGQSALFTKGVINDWGITMNIKHKLIEGDWNVKK